MNKKTCETVSLKEQANFSCQSCANCCKDFIVNLKFYDIALITENRKDLKITDFVEIIDEDEDYPNGIRGNLFGKQVPVLKKINGSCIFLKDNLCTIHKFKPMACKIWPFTLKDNEPIWEKKFYSFLNTKCGYKLKDNAKAKQELTESLIVNEKYKQDFISEITAKNNSQKQEYIIDISICLKENLNFYNENDLLELTTFEVSLTNYLEGKTEIIKQEFFSENYFTKPLENFSSLFFTHVLEKTRNPEAFLQNLYSKTNEKQQFIFIVKNSLNALFIKLLTRQDGIIYSDVEKDNTKEFNYFTLESLKRLFSKNGFFIKAVHKYQKKYSPELKKQAKAFENVFSVYFDLTKFHQEMNSFCYILVVQKIN
jgi:Fe-S-cluster containining protein